MLFLDTFPQMLKLALVARGIREVDCACWEGGEASGAWFPGCLLRLVPRMFARDALQTLQMHSQGSVVFTSVSPKVAKSNR